MNNLDSLDAIKYLKKAFGKDAEFREGQLEALLRY